MATNIKTIVERFVNTHTMSDVLVMLARFGITVKILNTKLDRYDEDTHTVFYVPAFSVSFAQRGVQCVGYIYEEELNGPIINGIAFMTDENDDLKEFIDNL